MICKCFPPVYNLVLYFLTACFRKVINFYGVQVIIFPMNHVFSIMSENSLPNRRSWKFSPLFFLKFLSFYIHIYDLFWDFFLYRMWSLQSCFFFFLAYGCSTVSIPFVEKSIFSSIKYIWAFFKNQLSIFVWIDLWILCCVPLIYTLTLHKYHTVLITWWLILCVNLAKP